MSPRLKYNLKGTDDFIPAYPHTLSSCACTPHNARVAQTAFFVRLQILSATHLSGWRTAVALACRPGNAGVKARAVPTARSFWIAGEGWGSQPESFRDCVLFSPGCHIGPRRG